MTVPASVATRQVYAGDGYALLLTLTDDDDPAGPYDVTGRTFTAQVRRTRRSSDVLAEFDIAVNTTDDVTELLLTLTGAQTAALPTECVWDLEMNELGAEPVTLLTGPIEVTKDVTRADD